MSDVSRVEQIFLNAVHINPAERAQFLDEQCGQDADLRQRVEKLLAAQPRFKSKYFTCKVIAEPPSKSARLCRLLNRSRVGAPIPSVPLIPRPLLP